MPVSDASQHISMADRYVFKLLHTLHEEKKLPGTYLSLKFNSHIYRIKYFAITIHTAPALISTDDYHFAVYSFQLLFSETICCYRKDFGCRSDIPV